MKLFWLCLLLFCITSCYQSERNCNEFRTGTFEFDYTINGEVKKGTFVRTESLNIDYYENKIDTASIRWINDCEFILKKLHPKNKAEEKAIHMKIMKTMENSYTFEYQLAVKNPNKKPRIEKGLARKIK
ncbi:hypothetical protein A9Q87_12045 [Flavobacteriales bacterium 34_180_T64]|nr:hypothetical protein A9Q87_12045 [Flavobacteriales bacterium 34_180_T64]